MNDLSVIIPVRDEEKNIPELIERLEKTIKSIKLSYEIIFVTDINEDNTFELLEAYNKKNKHIKVIKLSNSFGQHIAVVAGLSLCTGQSVTIMDGDLQDYPEDIPALYNKLHEGHDIVYGIKNNKNDSFIRNLFSKLFVSIMNSLSDIKNNNNTSMFRIISKRTVDEVLKFKEKHQSLTFIMSLISFPTATIPVTSGERKEGKTKYNFFRLLNFGIASLTSFSIKPIRIISMLGFFVSGLSFIYMCIIIIQRIIFNISILGWATIIALITFLGGVQLLCIGIIGEYISKIFIETKNRPLYVIDKKIGKFK